MSRVPSSRLTAGRPRLSCRLEATRSEETGMGSLKPAPIYQAFTWSPLVPPFRAGLMR